MIINFFRQWRLTKERCILLLNVRSNYVSLFKHLFFYSEKNSACFILFNWNAFVVCKLTFPSTFMIKHKTFPELLLQPSDWIIASAFMKNSFNIDVSLNLKFHIKSTQLGNCRFSIKVCRACSTSLSKHSLREIASSLSMLPWSLVIFLWQDLL